MGTSYATRSVSSSNTETELERPLLVNPRLSAGANAMARTPAVRGIFPDSLPLTVSITST